MTREGGACVEGTRASAGTVEHEGGLTRRGADDVGVERPVAPRQERVDLQARVGPYLALISPVLRLEGKNWLSDEVLPALPHTRADAREHGGRQMIRARVSARRYLALAQDSCAWLTPLEAFAGGRSHCFARVGPFPARDGAHPSMRAKPINPLWIGG